MLFSKACCKIVKVVALGVALGFGVETAKAGSIGDLIYFDNSATGTPGVFDAGIDSGIPSIAVTLTPPAGIDIGDGVGEAVTTLTDASGNYLFTGLPAGTYTLTVAGPSTAQQTADPNEVGLCATCDSSSIITITAVEDNLAQDFGYSTSYAGALYEWQRRDFQNRTKRGSVSGI